MKINNAISINQGKRAKALQMLLMLLIVVPSLKAQEIDLDLLAKYRNFSNNQITADLLRNDKSWEYGGYAMINHYWNSDKNDAILLLQNETGQKKDAKVILMTKNDLINKKIQKQIVGYKMKIIEEGKEYMPEGSVVKKIKYMGKYIVVETKSMRSDDGSMFIITTVSKI